MGGMQEDILDINTKSYGGKKDFKNAFSLKIQNNDNTHIPGNSNLGSKYFSTWNVFKYHWKLDFTNKTYVTNFVNFTKVVFFC